MKLFHRCLSFLLAVFLIQLIIFAGFLYTLAESQAKVDEARHSVFVAQRITSLHRGMQEWMSTFLINFGTGRSPLNNQYWTRTKELVQEYDNIQTELKENRDDYQDICKAREGFDYLRSNVEQIGKSLRDGTFDLPALFRYKTEGARGFNAHLDDISNSLAHIHKRHSLDTNKLNELERDRQNKFALLGFGMVLLITTAMSIIVLGFSHGVSRRIGILYDNFLRFGKDEPLNPEQEGGDEICHLDQAFRVLARDLQERTAKDRAVFAHMPSGLISCDETGRIESVNPMALSMLGRTSDDSVTANISELLETRGLTRSGNIEPIPENGSYRLVRGDGLNLPVDLTISTFYLNGEKKYLVALVDVSAREEVERMKQEFLSMVSHDLQTPLTSIGVCLDMLRSYLPENNAEPGFKYLHIAQGESARLIRLTRDILDLAKAESGQVVLHREVASTEAIVEQSIGAVIYLAERKGIEISDISIGVDIDCDPDKVSQILVNFLSNAIKYSPANTKIRIVTELIGDSLIFSVIDQGRGIPEESIGHVFDRFKQVYDKDSSVGTGLGLAICKILAEAHGGTVGVESVEAQGSKFWLSLPVMNSS